jgi:MFS family permease
VPLIIDSIKKALFDNYLINYVDVPKGTGKILPLVVIESLAMCVAHLISIYLVNSLHFSPFQVGKLISALSLGTCLGSLLSGYLTIKISVIKVSALGLLIYALGFFLLFCITSYHFLLGILFLCGVGGVFMMIANLTALIKLADDDAMKNRIIVLQSVVFNLSFSISGFFMSYLRPESLKNVFLVFGLMLLISGIFMLQLKENFNLIARQEKSSYPIKMKLSVIGTLLPVIFFYGMIYSLVKIHLPIEAVSRFHSPFYSWLTLSMNPLMIIFFQPLLLNKLKNKSNSALLIIGACCLGSGYILFGLTTYLIPGLLFVFLATLGEMLLSPISKKLASSSFGAGKEF